MKCCQFRWKTTKKLQWWGSEFISSYRDSFLSFLCLRILHSPFCCFTWFHSFNFLCMCSMKPQNSSQDLLHHNSSCEHLHFWNLKCAAMRLISWKGDPKEPLDLWFFVFFMCFYGPVCFLFFLFFFSLDCIQAPSSSFLPCRLTVRHMYSRFQSKHFRISQWRACSQAIFTCEGSRSYSELPSLTSFYFLSFLIQTSWQGRGIPRRTAFK